MNKQLVLFALAGVVLFGTAAFFLTHKTSKVAYSDDVLEQWKQFKKTYNKKYADPDYEAYRIQVFAKNLESIKDDKTGTMGVTQFFDLTDQEFASIYLTLKVEREVEYPNEMATGGDINWVKDNKVSAVKNQGSCGSCWSFSATGALESALIIKNKATTSIDLSEQQLVDCSKQNSGCNGGLMDYAFSYIKSNSITTNSNYGYIAQDEACQTKKIASPLYSLSGYTDVIGGVTALKTALAKQPISIAVNASNWSKYVSGVFSNCVSTGLNHGVLLVGFESDAWIVKNSWGTSWGEKGYIRLANGNTCGLANQPSYPTV